MEINPKIIECIYSRIILGIIIFVLLPFLLYISIYGLIIGFSGFSKFNILQMSIGIINVLGLIGFIAAISRLFKKHQNLSINQISILRKMLIGGVVSSTLLIVGCIYVGMSGWFSVLFFILSLVGLVFIFATPNKQG